MDVLEEIVRNKPELIKDGRLLNELMNTDYVKKLPTQEHSELELYMTGLITKERNCHYTTLNVLRLKYSNDEYFRNYCDLHTQTENLGDC